MPKKRVKIDVYLSSNHKKKILEKAKLMDLSVSDYMKLKALDMLKEDSKKQSKKTK